MTCHSSNLTRWKVYRVWISNGLILVRWFERDELGFETEICRGYETYNSEELKKEHTEEAQADVHTKEEEGQ